MRPSFNWRGFPRDRHGFRNDGTDTRGTAWNLRLAEEMRKRPWKTWFVFLGNNIIQVAFNSTLFSIFRGGLYRFTAQIAIFWSKNTANPRHISGSTLGRCSYRWCAIPRQRRKVQGEAQRSDVCWVINPTNTNSFD